MQKTTRPCQLARESRNPAILSAPPFELARIRILHVICLNSKTIHHIANHQHPLSSMSFSMHPHLLTKRLWKPSESNGTSNLIFARNPAKSTPWEVGPWDAYFELNIERVHARYVARGRFPARAFLTKDSYEFPARPNSCNLGSLSAEVSPHCLTLPPPTTWIHRRCIPLKGWSHQSMVVQLAHDFFVHHIPSRKFTVMHASIAWLPTTFASANLHWILRDWIHRRHHLWWQCRRRCRSLHVLLGILCLRWLLLRLIRCRETDHSCRASSVVPLAFPLRGFLTWRHRKLVMHGSFMQRSLFFTLANHSTSCIHYPRAIRDLRCDRARRRHTCQSISTTLWCTLGSLDHRGLRLGMQHRL